MAETILPGTYITVRDEGLISTSRIATGNIGIVGTASKGPVNEVVVLGSFSEAKEIFGEADEWVDGGNNRLTLIRALEYVYSNGGRAVYAVRTTDGSGAKKAMLSKPIGGNLVFEAKTPGTWGNDLKIEIKKEGAEANAPIFLEVNYRETKERYIVRDNSTLAKTINKSSALVSVKESGTTSAIGTTTAPLTFTVGSNGETAVEADYKGSLVLLEDQDVNIVLLAGKGAEMAGILQGHVTATSEIKRERVGLIGCSSNDASVMISEKGQFSNNRLIFIGPGLKSPQSGDVLSGAYTAAAVAGLLSSLPVQTSPTNKTINIPGLAKEFNSANLERLVQSNILVIENRDGFRIVKGITTSSNSAWHQITTRRIVDYAIRGVRSGCNPYIGKLNNERVRGALKATIDSFLTRMVNDEALTSYELSVTATRPQEIAGQVMVTMTLKPTFSIDFIMVTMYLN